MSIGKIELPISVIIPNYNNASNDFIKIAINSIFNNKYIPNECIIIDDCSTDNSIDLIEEMLLDIPQIKLLKNKENIVNAAEAGYPARLIA